MFERYRSKEFKNLNDAMYAACLEGEFATVRRLVDEDLENRKRFHRGVLDINLQRSDGRAPLHGAAYADNDHFLERSYGISVLFQTDGGGAVSPAVLCPGPSTTDEVRCEMFVWFCCALLLLLLLFLLAVDTLTFSRTSSRKWATCFKPTSTFKMGSGRHLCTSPLSKATLK